MNIRNTHAVLVLGLTSFFTAAALATDEAGLTPAPADRAAPGNAIPDRYIVEVRAGVNPQAVAPANRWVGHPSPRLPARHKTTTDTALTSPEPSPHATTRRTSSVSPRPRPFTA